MKKRDFLLLGAILLSSQSVAASVNSIQPSNNWFVNNFDFSANTTLASNWMFRGISQTNNGPAVQGQLKVTSKQGFYLGSWGSNVYFPDAAGVTTSLEINYFGGYTNKINLVKYDLGVLHYSYPQRLRVDFTEYYLNLNYKVFTAGVSYSGDLSPAKDTGVYYFGGIDYSIPTGPVFKISGVTVGGHIGSWEFSKGNNSYTDYQAYISKALSKVVSVQAAWTDTDGGAHAGRLAGSTIIGSITAAI